MNPNKASVNLPTIDFSNLDFNNPSKNPEEWEIAKSQVLKAVEEYGCFKAVCKKISLELRKRIISDLEELFALPLDTKMKNISETHNGGYIGKTKVTPLHESLGITDPCNLEKVDSLTKVLWPEGRPSFSKNIQSYAKQVMEMEKTIRRMIVESLGLEKYLEEHINCTTTALRVIRYEVPTNSGQPETALAAHIDQAMIAILYQNLVGGLEVQSKFNKADWISVQLEPDNFVVLIGETFQAWTNGRIYAPPHRVIMSGNVRRYSVGKFTAPKGGYIVKAPEELVDEEHPLLYRPYDFNEVLQLFQAKKFENSPMDFPTIKDFFGI